MIWDVSPEIFKMGSHGVRWYGLLFALSFFLGMQILRWMYRIEKKNLADVDQLLLYMIVGTTLGARLGHTLFYEPARYLQNPIEILKIWQGGLASHGAFIGITLALFLYARKKPDQPYLWVLDRIAVAVPLGGCLIRLGNLMNSEILGSVSDVPWAMVFTRVDQLPRHPAQIYESLAYFAIFWIMFFVYRKTKEKTPQGRLFGLFLILVFGFRFFVEFFKAEQVAFEQGMLLNMGQILSIPVVGIGIYFYWKSFLSKQVKS